MRDAKAGEQVICIGRDSAYMSYLTVGKVYTVIEVNDGSKSFGCLSRRKEDLEPAYEMRCDSGRWNPPRYLFRLASPEDVCDRCLDCKSRCKMKEPCGLWEGEGIDEVYGGTGERNR
jgi:hypothetical protein